MVCAFLDFRRRLFMAFALLAAGENQSFTFAPLRAASPVVIAIGGTCLFDQERRDQRRGVSRVDTLAQEFATVAVDRVRIAALRLILPLVHAFPVGGRWLPGSSF